MQTLSPTITMTTTAREQILAAINTEGRTAQGLRLIVKHAGTRNQTYGLSLVEKSTPDVNDVVIDVDGIRVFLEKHNTAFVDGATIDFLNGPGGSGFKIESPYKPTTVEIPTNPPTGPMADSVQKIIREQVNPAVASHGGYVSLVDIRDDVVFVRFGGGCHGCGMADVTLKQGVATMIKKAVPEVKDVLDITDHANGANPYYQAH
jgi:Fe/S biogenesis protein NfuA